jgi:FSR family fosmidomycin resistance protein-like MFS transporter
MRVWGVETAAEGQAIPTPGAGRRIAGAPSRAAEPAAGAWAALAWVHFLNDGLSAYLPGVLPYLALERGVPLAAASGLMTVLVVAQVLQPLMGAWADRLGGRSLILAGPALAALGTIGLALAPSYALLAVCLFLVGLGTTVFHPQALAAVRSVAVRRQGTAMSGFLIGGETGRAVGPLAAAVLVAHRGFGALALLALPFALTAPWAWRAFPRLPARTPRSGPSPWRRQVAPAAALVTFTTLRATAIYAVSTFVPILWHERGGSLVAGASLVTTLVGVGILGNLGGGAAADRWGRRPVLLWSTLCAGAALPLLLFAKGVWLWPALAISGVALFSSLPVTMLIGQDTFPGQPALGSGVALGVANGLGAVLLLPLGVAAAHWGAESALALVPLLVLAGLPCIPRLAAAATA